MGVSLSRKRKREAKRIWLPTELWVDTFKLLSRRVLLRHVQPVCRRFYTIAELLVDNAHVIRNLDLARSAEDHKRRSFMKKISQPLKDQRNGTKPEDWAKLEIVSRNFRIREECVYDFQLSNQWQTRAQTLLLRPLLVLFQGCNLTLSTTYHSKNNARVRPDVLLDCLNFLQSIRPFHVHIMSNGPIGSEERLLIPTDELLCQPIILNCTRMTVGDSNSCTLNAEYCVNWLHHLPIVDNSRKSEVQPQQIIRMFKLHIQYNVHHQLTADLVGRCKQAFLRARTPADRRAYVLIITTEIRQDTFQLNNYFTGELLQFEKLEMDMFYRLHRCQTADLATAMRFYCDTFTSKWLFRKVDIKLPSLSVDGEKWISNDS